jgi:hypothetical protein
LRNLSVASAKISPGVYPKLVEGVDMTVLNLALFGTNWRMLKRKRPYVS